MRQCIAVHFRGGKILKLEGRRQSAAVYSQHLRLVSRWLGVRDVYFASDDPQALGRFERWHPELSFHSMHMALFPSTNAPYGMEITEFLKNHWDPRDGRDEAMAALANVYLLGSCEYFIGAVSSNMGRTSRELMAFALDGRPAAATDVDNDVPFEGSVHGTGHVACQYPGLSLPVEEEEEQQKGALESTGRGTGGSGVGEASMVYLLHMPKSGGTYFACLLFNNMFRYNDQIAHIVCDQQHAAWCPGGLNNSQYVPFFHWEMQQQLVFFRSLYPRANLIPNEHGLGASFLPDGSEIASGLRLRYVTIVREPLDRAVSHFYYMNLVSFIHGVPNRTLQEWADVG